MKKKILLLFFSLFIIPLNVYAAESYDCYYVSEDGKSSVGYDKQEKSSGAFNNNSVHVIKFKNKKVDKNITGNQSKGDQIPNKCYKYVSITSTKVITSGRTTYSFKLGDSLDDVSVGSNAKSAVLKLNGFKEDSKEKVCQNSVSSSTNYNTDLDKLDLNIKSTYSVTFNFVTKEDGKREFIVSYDGVKKSSGLFEGTNVPTVTLDNLKNDAGETVTFSVNGKYADSFFDSCVAPVMFNLKKNGSTYSLVSERAEDKGDYKPSQGDLEINDVYICEANSKSLKIFQVIGYLILIAKIIAPIILIILASITFAKAALSNDDRATMEAAVTFGKKVLIGLIIFFVPTILDFGLSLISGVSDTMKKFKPCTACILSPNDSSRCSPRNLQDSSTDSSTDTSNDTDTKNTTSEFDCNYMTGDGKTYVGYNLNSLIRIIKYNGKEVNMNVSEDGNNYTKNTHSTNKCYQYITVYVYQPTAGYIFAYNLGDTSNESKMEDPYNGVTLKLQN